MSAAPPLEQVDRTHVWFRGRKLSYFSGCDYFRLSSHPLVLRSLRAGVRQLGLNVAASRVTTGNHPVYGELEQALCDFFGAQSSLLFSSGYVANLAAAQALAGEFSHALMDERAHASLADAAQWLDCPVLPFRHRDAAHVEAIARRIGPKARPILLTDGMFAHDGSVAPLAEYQAVLPKRAWMLVDDAHAAGVLGANGRGSLEHCGIARDRVLQTITLSKAFGVYGGAVVGSGATRQRIVAKSRLFAGNTPIPPPLAKAALSAVHLLKRDATLRRKLWNNVHYLRARLREKGFSAAETPGPIVSFVPRNRKEIASVTKRLLASGIYPPLIRYPGGPALGYFRFAISSEHRRAQLDAVGDALCNLTTLSFVETETFQGEPERLISTHGHGSRDPSSDSEIVAR